MSIPILNLRDATDHQRVASLLKKLRLDPADLALERGRLAGDSAAVKAILADVAARGDAAIVDSARKFDDPNFTAVQLRVTPREMAEAGERIPANQLAALRRSIAQVREYQTYVLP